MFDLLSKYLTAGLGVALAASLALAGYQWGQATKARGETASARAEFATYRETQERQTREALQALNADKAKSDKAQQEALDAEHHARLATQADADRLRGTAGQLQRYATDLATSLRNSAGDPAAPSSSAPTDTSADLLANLSGRLDEAAAGIALHADTSRVAGQTCERYYDALRR